MNLTNLFELQQSLDEHIETEHPRQEGESRANKKILALLVELGELANEWRGFKFWSKDQKPRVNPLLEEYVDGIHFLLSLGLEMKVGKLDLKPIKLSNLNEQFIGLYNAISILHIAFSDKTYHAAFAVFMGLGEMLGFSWEEIEAAYLEKNRKNHERQEFGY